MSAIDPADVLALLEEKPYLEEELVALFGVPANIVRFVLKGLYADHQVRRVGTERRWALASYVAPLARPHLTKPARMLPDFETDQDVEMAVEDDVVASEIEEDQAPLEVEPPPQRERGQRRLYPKTTDAGGAPLRQASRVHVPIDTPPAWWVTAPRENFSGRAKHEQERMRSSKEALQVPFRMLK